VAERTWDGHTRPDWMTDEEVVVVATRTKMAMAEMGDPIDWKPDPSRSMFRADRRPSMDNFRKARALAMASIGAVLVDDELVEA